MKIVQKIIMFAIMLLILWAFASLSANLVLNGPISLVLILAALLILAITSPEFKYMWESVKKDIIAYRNKNKRKETKDE